MRRNRKDADPGIAEVEDVRNRLAGLKEGLLMITKRILAYLIGMLLILIIFSPSIAQIQELHEFKGVKIPWTLKYEDMEIKKGKYDLVFLRHGTTLFYLKIKKEGKTICLIPDGERVKYQNQGDLFALHMDPEIPENAKLQIKRNPVVKIAYIIFESGKHTRICPFHKIRFKLKYEE